LALIGAIAGLYGLYLLYLGLPKLKKTPADKQMGYFVVSLVVLIVIYFVINLIMQKVIMSSMGLSYGTSLDFNF
jgi:membrane associated rhomboid family serine protease